MIKITMGRTYNLGNYENIYLEMVQDGDNGADPQRLFKEAEKEVEKFYQEYMVSVRLAKSKVGARKKEIAAPIDHVDVTLEE